MRYVVFCFLCYGIVINIVYNDFMQHVAKLLDQHIKMRLFTDMFECVKCTAFWMGIIIFPVFPLHTIPQTNIFTLILNIVISGFLSSGMCWFVDGLRRE